MEIYFSQFWRLGWKTLYLAAPTSCFTHGCPSPGPHMPEHWDSSQGLCHKGMNPTHEGSILTIQSPQDLLTPQHWGLGCNICILAGHHIQSIALDFCCLASLLALYSLGCFHTGFTFQKLRPLYYFFCHWFTNFIEMKNQIAAHLVPC